MNGQPSLSKTAAVDAQAVVPRLWSETEDTIGKKGLLVRQRPYGWLTNIFWLSVVLFGAIDGWVSRFAMNTDGISYLDVASKFVGHDWLHGVNAYWSPLYPLLLSIAIQLLRPSAYWEFPLVHFVNFVIFLGSAAAFEFFLSRLIRYQRERAARLSIDERMLIPEWGIRAAGYSLFVWISLQLTPIEVVSPDMTVAMFIYLAAGIVLGIFSGLSRFRDYALLGAILGLGFLAKAPVLPVGLVFLGAVCLAGGTIRKTATRIPLALAAMALVAGPFVVSLSHLQGRLSWGDSAKLNYAWYVNGLPRYHWHGDRPQNGAPTHPTKLLLADPPVYSFDGPQIATYSIWYDPAFWNDGIHVVRDVRSLARQLVQNSLVYEKVVFHEQGCVVVICLFLFLLGWSRNRSVLDFAGYWMLLVPVVAALGMYALVHVELRMISAFLVILWMTLFVAVRLSDTPGTPRIAAMALVALALFAIATQAASVMGQATSESPKELLSLRNPNSNPAWVVATELHNAGIRPGDKVAWIRPAAFTATHNYDWARLAKLRIIAEVPTGDEDRFWSASPSERLSALERIAQTGAVAFVVTGMPPGIPDHGWKRLGNSGYLVYLLGPAQN